MLHADTTIIGGGITGLSIAASFLERDPNRNIRILERSAFPYGASTRNAGFACFGSPTELASDMELMGADAARELVFKRWMGIQITRKRLTDAAIGYVESGGYELVEEGQLDAMELEALNDVVADFLPDYFANATDRKADLGIEAPGKLISIQGEGQVNSGQLMKSLRNYVSSMGAEIINGTSVETVNQQGSSYEIELNDSVRSSFLLTSQHVIVANNAFAGRLLEAIELKPGRGQVLLTEPIPNLKFRGNLHIEEGFYYLRDLGNRIMFGGGRNLNKAGEETTEQGLTDQIQSALEEYLIKLFGQRYKIEQRWSGTMGFTSNKQPMVHRTPEGIWVVAGLSGMGIALAGYLGEELADAW